MSEWANSQPWVPMTVPNLCQNGKNAPFLKEFFLLGTDTSSWGTTTFFAKGGLRVGKDSAKRFLRLLYLLVNFWPEWGGRHILKISNCSCVKSVTIQPIKRMESWKTRAQTWQIHENTFCNMVNTCTWQPWVKTLQHGKYIKTLALTGQIFRNTWRIHEDTCYNMANTWKPMLQQVKYLKTRYTTWQIPENTCYSMANT